MKRILFSLVLMACLPVPAFSQGLQLDDWYRLDRLSDAQFAPDSQSIAFVVTRADREQQRNLSQIWLVAADGKSEPYPFTRGSASETHPRWSPDGKRLAFLTRRVEDERSQIYVLPAGGGEAVRVTDFESGVEDFAWSPEGSRFAVVARTGPRMDPNDPLAGVIVIRTARYDQDRRGFFGNLRSHVFVVDAATGESMQITDGEDDNMNPAWSPDGKWIAFVSDRTGRAFEGSRNTDVFIVLSTGGEPRRISSHEGADGNPVFSPDSRSIAFSGAVGRTDQSDIWMVPVGGGTPVNLTESFDERLGAFVWAEKGIFFTARRQGTTPLFKLDVTAREAEIVDGEGMRVNSFSISDAGDWVYIQDGFRHPGDIHITRENNRRRSRRVTDFHRQLVRERTMVAAKEFWYEADDGFDIQGWFVKPLGFEEGREYPLILRIHGGPAGMYGIAFDHEVQVMAARGYAMVYVNPRGSSGYGQTFVRANDQDWGGGDFGDIMKGVDTVLAEHDWIDTDRMAIYGCSYGGFMTSLAITRTDRFAAAAPECIISNWISFWGTYDNAYNHEVAWGGSLWEVYDLMWDRSPLKHARNVKTPALFIQGEADERTPADQVEQMFRALKRNGVETELVRYPGENHGHFQNGKPAHYVDRIKRILAWFDKYTNTNPPSN